METIFKTGMEVYDQFNFPNTKGTVVKIQNNDSKYPIQVIFDENIYVHHYTLTGCYKEYALPTLSTKPYVIQFEGFEQKAATLTYKEALDWIDKCHKNRHKYNEELCLQTEALKKLIILRDYYNEGWQPDWCDDTNKFCIEMVSNKLHLEIWHNTSKVLYFKSLEIANKFLEEQIELLETAKPLI